MKTLILILICAFIQLTANGQRDLDCNQNEKVKIFGVTIESKDVTGGCFGNSSHYYRSKLNPTLVDGIDGVYRLIGSYRTRATDFETNNLFNLSHQYEIMPELDEIDIPYYNSVGFGRLTRERKKQGDFKTFRTAWNRAKTIEEKKKVLIRSESVMKDLVATRFSQLSVRSFKIDQEVSRQLTSRMDASLDTLKFNGGTISSAEIKAQVIRKVQRAVKIEGVFIVAELSNEYIGRIRNRFAGKSTLQGDYEFVTEYNRYSAQRDARINTGVSAIALQTSIDHEVLSRSALAADLMATFKLDENRAKEIGGLLNTHIEQSLRKAVSSIGNEVCILRYFTSRNIDEVVGSRGVPTSRR